LLGAERENGGQDLQRDVAMKRRVARATNLTHAATAKGRTEQDFVRAEPSAGCEGHEQLSRGVGGVFEPRPAHVFRPPDQRTHEREPRGERKGLCALCVLRGCSPRRGPHDDGVATPARRQRLPTRSTSVYAVAAASRMPPTRIT